MNYGDISILTEILGFVEGISPSISKGAADILRSRLETAREILAKELAEIVAEQEG